MSVAIPVIASIDPILRLIFLKVGVRSYHPVDDIAAEVADLRLNNEALRNYDIFVYAFGYAPKNSAGTQRTPRYAVFYNTKVVPDDIDHDLAVTGEQLFAPGTLSAGTQATGSGAACIDKTVLSAGTDVNIDYTPPQAEVIVVSTGSGLSVDQDTKLTILSIQNQLLIERLSLELGVSVTNNIDGSFSFGSVNVTTTTDPAGNITQTRQS